MPDIDTSPLQVPAGPLPPDDAHRAELHNEVHARPPEFIHLPALVLYVAVLNEGVTRQAEAEHLRQLPGQQGLQTDDLHGNFLRLSMADHSVRWERHSEFTRYSIVQPLPAQWQPGSHEVAEAIAWAVDRTWLQTIPGRTVAAVELLMLPGDVGDVESFFDESRRWVGGGAMLASSIGGGFAGAITDFQLRDSGFERMLVIAAPRTNDARIGRLSQTLLELETYRLMALRGLPVAKSLGPTLQQAEAKLADITARLEGTAASDQDLLTTLIELAARIERATAEHGYRFSATQAYDALVRQRIVELDEASIAGSQTIGAFMQRRLSPAIATVAATASRLASLSQRIERAGALLRTRVDIATETQNQQLLAKLTRGQQLQLRLQSTVEGLSIAAISYYVVSLLVYGGKAAKAAGLPVDPEFFAGAMIPVVLWTVWRLTRRIHRRLYGEE